MKCPACSETELIISERQNVEIDYCPKCRGVWLDRGELDKIIERVNRDDDDDDANRKSERYPQHSGHGGGYQRKRKSFWTELFD